MRDFRCKCGKATAYGSMDPGPCATCEDCGSDLASAPNLHREPAPHDPGPDGFCRRCGEPTPTPEQPASPAPPARRMQGCCYDCGRKYGDEFGFPDLLVPNDVWRAIGPTGKDGGLLCPSCIVRRCVLAGIECEARWLSGPFVMPAQADADTDDTANWMRRPTPGLARALPPTAAVAPSAPPEETHG